MMLPLSRALSSLSVIVTVTSEGLRQSPCVLTAVPEAVSVRETGSFVIIWHHSAAVSLTGCPGCSSSLLRKGQ